jgi:hypothetical protein
MRTGSQNPGLGGGWGEGGGVGGGEGKHIPIVSPSLLTDWKGREVEASQSTSIHMKGTTVYVPSSE